MCTSLIALCSFVNVPIWFSSCNGLGFGPDLGLASVALTMTLLASLRSAQAPPIPFVSDALVRVMPNIPQAVRRLEMGIEPNNEGSGSVRFGYCQGSGSVRVRLILSSGSVWFDPPSGSGSVRVRKSLCHSGFSTYGFF